MLTSYNKKSREPKKDLEQSTADPLRYRCITLINRKSTAVQAPGSKYAGPWESEYCLTSGKMSAKWHAQTSTHV